MLGRSTGYSTRPTSSPVRLRLGPPSLLFRTGAPLDQSSCRIPTPKLAHRRGIFAVGTLWSGLLRDERGTTPVYPPRNGVIRLCAPPRPQRQQSLRWLVLGCGSALGGQV